MLVRKKACLDTTESPLKKETPSKAASKRGQVKSSTVPTNPIKFSVSPSGGTALAQSSVCTCTHIYEALSLFTDCYFFITVLLICY